MGRDGNLTSCVGGLKDVRVVVPALPRHWRSGLKRMMICKQGYAGQQQIERDIGGAGGEEKGANSVRP